eukprot:6213125-Pleurochrysis_carterae.AAC.2
MDEYVMRHSPSLGRTADGVEDGARSPRLRSVRAVCTRYNDGQPCRREVVYHAPHYCEQCLNSGMGGMRCVRPKLSTRITTNAEPWRNKIGNDVLKKLQKLKEAQANLSLKLSPVALEVFQGLYDLVANLQPSDDGRHITPLRQTAGSRGGEKQEHEFEIVSGALVAAFMKSTFVESYCQGSLLLRDNGNVFAVIAPMTFRLKYSLPVHRAELLMTVTFDVASLPRDGIFRFDEEKVQYSEASKRHMKAYMCGELRKLVDVFASLHVAANMNGPPPPLLSNQQLVQVNFFAPAGANVAASSAAASSQFAAHGVAGSV